MTAFKLKVGGVELECAWIAEHQRTNGTLVLLHEGLGSVAMWKDFPQALASATQNAVFVYSRQGYGASDSQPGPFGPDYMHREARDVLPLLLRAAGIERPVLFGHSDGGSIALLFAAAYPDRTAGLVLEAPHVFVEQLTVDSISVAKVVFETTDLRDKLARYHAHPDQTFRGWNDIWLDSRFRDWTIEAEARQVSCPVLVIQGLQDEYGTVEQVERIVRDVRGAQALYLEACGHSPHRDQPAKVIDATSDFVAQLAQADAASEPG